MYPEGRASQSQKDHLHGARRRVLCGHLRLPEQAHRERQLPGDEPHAADRRARPRRGRESGRRGPRRHRQSCLGGGHQRKIRPQRRTALLGGRCPAGRLHRRRIQRHERCHGEPREEVPEGGAHRTVGALREGLRLGRGHGPLSPLLHGGVPPGQRHRLRPHPAGETVAGQHAHFPGSPRADHPLLRSSQDERHTETEVQQTVVECVHSGSGAACGLAPVPRPSQVVALRHPERCPVETSGRLPDRTGPLVHVPAVLLPARVHGARVRSVCVGGMVHRQTGCKTN